MPCLASRMARYCCHVLCVGIIHPCFAKERSCFVCWRSLLVSESKKKQNKKNTYLCDQLHSVLNERYLLDRLWCLRPQNKPEVKETFIELVFLAVLAGLKKIGSDGIDEVHLSRKIFLRLHRDPRTQDNGLKSGLAVEFGMAYNLPASFWACLTGSMWETRRLEGVGWGKKGQKRSRSKRCTV